MSGKKYFNSIGRADRSLGFGWRYGQDWPAWAKRAYRMGWMYQATGIAGFIQ